MKAQRNGFTLIELLVVVAIIALLIAILLPSLGRARALSRAVKCGAQMRAVGSGVAGYNAENNNVFPPSYAYPDQYGNLDFNHQPTNPPPYGYQHWSYFVFGNTNGLKSFTCPEFVNGGLSRTNPGPNSSYWTGGQVDQNGNTSPTSASLEDRQAPFMAFTANAAIMSRNKYTLADANSDPSTSPNSGRLNVFVKRTQIDGESKNILMTEFCTSWQAITSGGGIMKIVSHRPINPFYNLSSGTNEFTSSPSDFFTNVSTSSLYDVKTLQNAINAAGSGGQSLIADPNTELNAVGRNHPGAFVYKGINYGGSSNFLYVDGHVERKNVCETVINKEWGDRYYAINGDNSVR